MEFFRFLEKESKALDRRLLILGVIAGMLNMFIIFTLTVAAGKVVQSESNLWQLAIVVLALFGFWLSESTLMRHMTMIVEQIVERVRRITADYTRYEYVFSVTNRTADRLSLFIDVNLLDSNKKIIDTRFLNFETPEAAVYRSKYALNLSIDHLAGAIE